MGQAAGNRGPWIIAGAILLAAAAVVGVLLFMRQADQECKEWQAEVREAAIPFAIALERPTDQVYGLIADGVEGRPDGCALPSG